MLAALQTIGQSGDEIWAKAGTYVGGNKTFLLKNGLALYGGFAGTEVSREERDWATNVTILVGRGTTATHIVTGSGTDATAILDGFFVTNENPWPADAPDTGGGIFIESGSPSIANCTISASRSSSYGGGVYVSNGSPTFSNCRFGNNRSFKGAGVYTSGGSPTFADCSFIGNSAYFSGGGLESSSGSPILQRCTFLENRAGSGGGMYTTGGAPVLANCTFSQNVAGDGGSGGGLMTHGSAPAIFNTTFSGNIAESGGAIGSSFSGGPTLVNSILWANSPGEIFLWSGTSASITTSIVQGGCPSGCSCENVQDVDPLLGGLAAHGGVAWSYVLKPGSPAMDAGDDDACAAPPVSGTAQNGQPRPQGPHCDIGAHEAETDEVPPVIIRVADNGTASGACGSDWSSPCSLRYALEARARSGDEIWVETGTYLPTPLRDHNDFFRLSAGVALYGGFAGNENARAQRDWTAHPTILSGEIGLPGPEDNSCAVVYSNGADGTAVLDGFVVSGAGRDLYRPCLHPARGGLYNFRSSPTVANCTFSGNNGGMTNDYSSPAVTACFFSGNTAGMGAGMYNGNSSPTVTGCTFSGNTAEMGAGMYNGNSSPLVSDCVFANNTATGQGGGMHNGEGEPVISRCVFRGNVAGGVDYSLGQGGGMYNEGSSPVVSDCIFDDNRSVGFPGGGIYSREGRVTIAGSTFSANFGYGMASDTMELALSGCTFSSNSDGGLRSFDRSATIVNSTFSGNSGYGIYLWDGAYQILNCTVADNKGDAGINWAFGTLALKNSIVWGNSGHQLWTGTQSPTIRSCVIQGCRQARGICVPGDPRLAPLGDYGGETMSRLLQPGSSAIDAGDDAVCSSAPVLNSSQNGLPRPQGGRCDIGAFELGVARFHSTGAFDGWVRESRRGSNKGGALDRAGSALRVGDDSLNRQYRAIVSLPTGTLPAGSRIVGAALDLRSAGVVGSSPFASHGKLAVDINCGGFSGSDGLQLADFSSSASLRTASSLSRTSRPGWYRATLDGNARRHINRGGTTQFRLHFARGTDDDRRADYLALFSGDAAPDMRPVLKVQFYQP